MKLRLTEIEVLDPKSNNLPPHKLSPSSFIRMGLELEDQQYVLYVVSQESNTFISLQNCRQQVIMHLTSKNQRMASRTKSQHRHVYRAVTLDVHASKGIWPAL